MSSSVSAPAALRHTRLNITLWTAQIILAVFYGGVGLTKLTQPIPALTAMMIWPGVMPEGFVRFVGAAEFAGALGLILPAATRILPSLTPLAAVGLVLLQLCAMTYHISRGEFQILPLNTVLLLVPAFILWGRWRTAPIAAR